jgi:acetate kinase
MGFSPLGGPMMATRSGDLDPLLPLFLIRQAGMTPRRVEQLLEQQSGLFAMSGSADLRDSLSALGHHQHGWPPAKRVSRKQAQLSVDMLTYEVARYIGSYVAFVPHVDSIVFTGAIGQNAQIRKNILRWLHHRETWQTHVIPADEERAMVRMVESVV